MSIFPDFTRGEPSRSSCASGDRRRIRSQMKIVLGRIDETRVQEAGMPVIPSGVNIFVESGYGGGISCPGARLRPGGTVIKIVIDSCGRVVFFELRLVHRNKAA